MAAKELITRQRLTPQHPAACSARQTVGRRRRHHAFCLASTLLAMIAVSTAAHADELQLPAAPGVYQAFTMNTLYMDEEYELGVEKYQLDHETRITGWQVGGNWFFGHQRGEDSGLTLVWQRDQEQVSFSKDGVRFTRRF